MVRYLTTNGKSNTYGGFQPFALRYRRVNATFYEAILIGSKGKDGWLRGQASERAASFVPAFYV
jgi:hypothetical protein